MDPNHPNKGEFPRGKTRTAGGAWLANAMSYDDPSQPAPGANTKSKIGPVEDYLGDRNDPASKHYERLKPFRGEGSDKGGAHAFISPKMHGAIMGEWNSWGRDANFVAPRSTADKLVKDAREPGGRGIRHLEDKLGVPENQWVNQSNDQQEMQRYTVRGAALDKLNLRVPSGSENQAYGPSWDKEAGKYKPGEWVPGGTTLGGTPEAVLDGVKGPKEKVAGEGGPDEQRFLEVETASLAGKHASKTPQEERPGSGSHA